MIAVGHTAQQRRGLLDLRADPRLAAVGLRMRRYALLPVRDPKLAASLRFEND